jgi:hypothetical protein
VNDWKRGSDTYHEMMRPLSVPICPVSVIRIPLRRCTFSRSDLRFKHTELPHRLRRVRLFRVESGRRQLLPSTTKSFSSNTFPIDDSNLLQDHRRQTSALTHSQIVIVIRHTGYPSTSSPSPTSPYSDSPSKTLFHSGASTSETGSHLQPFQLQCTCPAKHAFFH